MLRPIRTQCDQSLKDASGQIRKHGFIRTGTPKQSATHEVFARVAGDGEAAFI